MGNRSEPSVHPETTGDKPMKLKAKYRPELICSKDYTRAAIMEPNVGNIRGKTSMVATDGRRLLVIPVEAEEKEFGRISKDAIRMARLTRQDKKQDTLNLVVNGRIELPNGWSFPRPDQKEFNYPNVENVIPNKTSQPHRVCFDAKMLWELAQSMGTRAVVLSFQDHQSAITVTALGDDAYGVLMPMRIE